MTIMLLDVHERLRIYGLEANHVSAALQRIRARGLDFVDGAIRNCIEAVQRAPKIGEPFQRRNDDFQRLLSAHYRDLISHGINEDFAKRAHATVEALKALGADNRVLLASASAIVQAAAAGHAPFSVLGGGPRPADLATLNALLICDAATAWSVVLGDEIRRERVRADTISAEVGRLDAFMATLSQQLDQASAKVDTTALGVANSITAALEASRDAASAAEAGNANLVAAASSIDELAQSTGQLSARAESSRMAAGDAESAVSGARIAIADLHEAVDRIGSIVDLISSIAEQTNLLALNATIEAARAGEAGRGFAVVAQEVKALASQTTKATQDISVQISSVQQGTSRSVAEIEQIGAAMARLLADAADVGSSVTQQAAATSDLNRMVNDSVREVTAAGRGYEQVAAHVARGQTAVEALKVAMAELAAVGSDLRRDIAAFSARIKAA